MNMDFRKRYKTI